MRLFVALWPPPDVITELGTALGGLRSEDGTGLRWTLPEQWHLTLAFLGEVDEGRLPELQRRLARVATRHAPLSLQFTGAARFGDRVLYTRVSGDREPLRRLAAAAAAAARRTGLPVEERPYRPHVTLARARGGTDLRPLVAALQDFRGTAWTSSALELIRSRLGSGPGRTSSYRTIASWPLNGRP
jgi:2'-5' RNA ligase